MTGEVTSFSDEAITACRWEEWFGDPNNSEPGIMDIVGFFDEEAKMNFVRKAFHDSISFPDEIDSDMLERVLTGLNNVDRVEPRLRDASGTWKIPGEQPLPEPRQRFQLEVIESYQLLEQPLSDQIGAELDRITTEATPPAPQS